MPRHDLSRTRWAAIGAAVAVTLAGGSVLTTSAGVDSGERAVYVPITPCRLFDTRPAPDTVGIRTSPLGPDETYPVMTRGTNGNCSVPLDAVGLVMNVAAIAPTASSFLTVFPSDAPKPLAANLNWVAGQPPLSNAVTADIAADGRISFYNLEGTVHVAADIVGYYVDHTHDDRYYTKTEVDARDQPEPRSLVFDGLLLQPLGPTNRGTSNGCGAYATASGSGGFPLSLPLGATISAVHVTMFDGSNAETYNVMLQRMVIDADSANAQNLGAFSGGQLVIETITHDIVPASPETVDAGESFRLAVTLGTGPFSNGICQVTVDYLDP